jgi:putative aldouronate transport system permease protein
MLSHKGALLLPLGFSHERVQAVAWLQMLFFSYKNTIIYLFAGTAINMALTKLGAYGLSRKNCCCATRSCS